MLKTCQLIIINCKRKQLRNVQTNIIAMAAVDRDEFAKRSSSSMHHVEKSLINGAGRTAEHNNSAKHLSVTSC